MTNPIPLSAEQLQAIKLFGSTSVVRDGVRVEEPAYGARAVQALLRVSYVQEDALLRSIFSEMGLSKAGVELFEKGKVMYRMPDAYGGGLEIGPRIPGVTDDNLSQYADTEEDFGVAGDDCLDVVIDNRPLEYKLNTLFNDVTLTDKLQLSSRRLQVAKRLALSEPSAAAASLADYLRVHGFPNVKVTAGDYAKTIGRARSYIRQFADTFEYKDGAAPSVVTNTDLMMTFDGFEEKTPKWTVIGPLKYATEVQAVYQAAVQYGPDQAMFVTAVETAILGIRIMDEVTGRPYTGEVRGYSSLAGIRPVDSSMPSELTAEQQFRLRAASAKVSPVFVGEAVIGSAVHVTDKHAILNEHTLTDAADAELVPELCDLPIYESRSVGDDIAMVQRDNLSAQWLLRDSVVGEPVVLCFSVGTRVEYSEVLRIQATHKGKLILSDSNVLRKGASGAAVVALRDFALLGIFVTKRASSVICAAFSSMAFSKVTDFMSVASSECVSTPSVGVGTRTYDRMVRKGLQSFLEGINDATVGLYVEMAGKRVPAGLAADVSGTWFTTVNPDDAQLMLRDGTKLRFSTVADGLYSVVDPPPVLKPLPNIRAVEPGERVFVFAKAGADVIMTAVRMVTHTHADGKRFVVEDFGDSDENLTGGLLVSERDAAVLGQLVAREYDVFGKPMVVCVPLHARPLLSVGVPSTVALVEARDVVQELGDWFRSDSAVKQMCALGQQLISLVGKQVAYKRAVSLDDGESIVLGTWSADYERIVLKVGWDPMDWQKFERYPRIEIAGAFVALLYLRDPGGFFGKMVFHLAPDFDPTPTIPLGDGYPFSVVGFPRDFIERPTSTTSAVSARTSVAPVDATDAKLRELEEKFSQLVREVHKSSTGSASGSVINFDV